jgi:SAM-dependent methyltransferase
VFLIGFASVFIFSAYCIFQKQRMDRKEAIAKSGPEEAAYTKLDAEVINEVRKGSGSKYYHAERQYADFEPFDAERMIGDFSKKFPNLPRKEIQKIIMEAIYYYCLRWDSLTLGRVNRLRLPKRPLQPQIEMHVPSLANGYERIAAEFLAGRGSVASGGVGVRHVRSWARSLPSHATVLDLGCGSGFPVTKALVDEGLTVYGVDASPTLVAAFRRHLPEVAVACESVEESTFFDRTFDAILSWGLWFLLPTVTQLDLPRRVASALQPGGRLLFTAPPQVITWLDAMTGEESRSLGAETYRRTLSAAGLLVLREYEDEGENHYYDAVKGAGDAAGAAV